MIDSGLLRRSALRLLPAIASLLLFTPGHSFAEIKPARVHEIAGWLAAVPMAAGPAVSNRMAWEKLAKGPGFDRIIADAERLAETPIPDLPDTLFLDFSNTGNRDRCQRVLSARDGRVTTLALAECLENRGRFIAPLAAAIDAVCKERTWVMPAHDRKLQNFNGKSKEMDLRATLVGWELASIDCVLGDKLPAKTRRLIRKEVEGRVLLPFREMLEGKRQAVSWIQATHNWNAVCLAGIAGAALALEPTPEDRAWYVAAAEEHIKSFLSGFTADGYCSEGMGYWNYGFGRFLMMGETIRQATGGRLDLLARPDALQPALFCTRTEVINGIYPTIADCHPGSRPDPLLVRYICERLCIAVPSGADVSFAQPSKSFAPTLIFAFLGDRAPALDHRAVEVSSPFRTWFTNGGVLICRPGQANQSQFAAVLKGGNNAEHHNHNDVGSFSVIAGRAMVVCDPGSEVYTARTFSSHRYDSKVLNSFGHAVPVVAGKLQEPGAKSKAVVLRTDFNERTDTLAMDIRSAYAVPELQKLERTFIFNRRDGGGLTVQDEVAFSSASAFETAIVTWGKCEKISEREFLVSDGDNAVRVQVDTGGRPFKMTSERLDEDVPTRTKPTRIGFALVSPVAGALVKLSFLPATVKTTRDRK